MRSDRWKSGLIPDLSNALVCAPQYANWTHWLLKAEPDSRLVKGVDVGFSIKTLQAQPNQTATWDGVRSPEARAILRDRIKLGHQCFFYHSGVKNPCVVGICEVRCWGSRKAPSD